MPHGTLGINFFLLIYLICVRDFTGKEGLLVVYGACSQMHLWTQVVSFFVFVHSKWGM